MYVHVAKPILFKMSPDVVHENLIHVGRFTQKIPFFGSLLNAMFAHEDEKMLGHEVFGIHFKNPIGLSAGFDNDAYLLPTMHAVGFGFSTVGSITGRPCEGNPKPWFYRLPNTKSVVVNKGLANDGAEVINTRIASYQKKTLKNMPIVVSVAKTNDTCTVTDEESIADYMASLRELQGNTNVDLFEINISCPNAYGGETFTTPSRLELLLSDIDSLGLKQSVIVKMPINLTWHDFDALLQVILRHHVDGVTIGNLQKDRSKAGLKEELPDSIQGNLSGHPTYEMSNELIARTYRKYGDKLKIIGVGGVFSVEEAYVKIKLGATLVEVITGVIFGGPQIVGQINHDLAQLLRRDGYSNVSQAVGKDVRAAK